VTCGTNDCVATCNAAAAKPTLGCDAGSSCACASCP
jgi:hypothetical protein